jgi:nucleoid DNA-binding protein
MAKLTKSDLIDVIAKKGHLTKKAATEAVEVFLGEVKRELKRGGTVVLSGFGTFYVGKVEDKEVVPFGKEDKRQTIRAHRVVNFRVGKPLKKIVW